MLNSQYIALSQQMAMRQQMDVIANNVANMNTTSFKSEHILFQEYLMGSDDPGQTYSYVIDYGIVRDFSEGDLITTNNPLDLAISGDGFFVIETDKGERYTRNGNFTLDETGTLVTKEGYAVLDDGGAEISFAPEDGAVSISRDGTITVEFGEAELGRIQVVTFANLTTLKKEGEGLYYSNQTPDEPETVNIVSGMIESSNVSAVVEMARMVELMRAYQAAGKLLQSDHDLQRDAIQRIGSVQ